MLIPSEVYNEKLMTFQRAAGDLHKRYNRLSTIRTIIFLAGLIALVYFANARNLEAIIVIAIVFPVTFFLIVKKHNKIRYMRSHARFLMNINHEELARLAGRLNSFDEGKRFIDEHHPYISDLDIFGKNSLFQLVNRCSTASGKAMLANWLKKVTEGRAIQQRQEAVKELSEKLDWRQDFQAAGKHYEEIAPDQKENSIHVLLEWINSPAMILQNKMYGMISYIMPMIAIITIALYFNGFSYLFPLAALAVNAIIMRKVSPVAAETYEKTNLSIKSLKAYLSMIHKIEGEPFHSEKLLSLKESFQHEKFSASAEIKKLKNILDRLETRGNAFFYIIFNLIFLLDIHFLRQAEKWKEETKVDIRHWFDAISEFEVLSSLAGLHFSNPEYCFPSVSDRDHEYKAKGLGHPLIKKGQRVCNDFKMSGKGKVVVLTGSNMSGKSTFLRTLGTNAVLALMGAPVCADQMAIANMQIFTSMRTEDSLVESVSSFYAELKRLRQLLDIIKEGKPVFFMLDEILKGTNSHDRHQGAAALIRQLGKKNASGLISTHDLELGILAQSNDNIYNYHFTSSIINDEIVFDYKLHTGICKSFNASKLMEKMGIEISNR